METKNEIIIGEYLVVEDIKGSFYVRKTYSNTKGALREIVEKTGFEYDENWNTRQFGAKLIGELKGEKIPSKGTAHAEYGPYVIYRTEEGSIVVYTDYENTKQGLREIAELIDLDYDTNLTTRQLGTRIIKRAVEISRSKNA